MTQVTMGNGGGFLGHAQEMLDTHPGQAIYDRTVLLDCIKACFDCAQACVACADACVSESEPKRLAGCIRLNQDCADICDAAGKILSRQTTFDRSAVRTVVQACVTICRSCAAECEKHAAMMQHCRVCAEACRWCERTCQARLA